MTSESGRDDHRRMSNGEQVSRLARENERSGVSTLIGIARGLETRGLETPRGGWNWQAAQVARIVAMSA
jgi:hypothetical protein